jgi:adenylosuccinate synthase
MGRRSLRLPCRLLVQAPHPQYVPLGLPLGSPRNEELDGWTEDTSGCREFDDLPKNTQVYVNRIEELCGARISGIGGGRRGSNTSYQRFALALVT